MYKQSNGEKSGHNQWEDIVSSSGCLEIVYVCKSAISWQQIMENKEKIPLSWNHASQGISGQPVPRDAHSHINITQANRFLDSTTGTIEVVSTGFNESPQRVYAVSGQSVNEGGILLVCY